MKNKYLLSILLTLVLSRLFGQHTPILIKDAKNGYGLPGVSLVLLEDSISRKFVSDQNGKILLTELKSGQYRLKTSYVGYLSIDTTIQLIAGRPVALQLKEETIALKGVNVSARKKFVEMKNGNFILNVQQSTLAKTSNTWDALKYGPLVETRMDGTLKVENKSATVFIDGRQVFMTGEELMKYLENIPAANIEKVEISSHPGAKYDSGIGAVILITTTNMKYQGVKGTINLSNGYGAFPRYNTGITLDAKKGKFISQLGYNYGRSKTQGITEIHTAVNPRNLPWAVSQNNINESQSHRAYGSFGVDFNKNNLLTLYAEYAPNTSTNVVMGNNGALTPQRQSQQDSVWQSLNNIRRTSSTFASQAIYESKWDSTRQSVKFTLAYSKNKGTNRVDNEVAYFDPGGVLKEKLPFYRALLPNQTDFVTVSGQYVRALWGGEWISGLRYYHTGLSNENVAYTYLNRERTIGETLSNGIAFEYNEFNYGAFTSWEAQVKSWYFQLGLRVEQNEVFSQTTSVPKGKLYNKLSPFPTLFVQKKINAKNVIAFNYSKQISRPDYSLLNPFSRFTDNTVANFVGNSQIRPARTHNLNLSWTHQNRLVFSAGAVILNDLISSILLRNSDGSLSQQYDNFNGVYYYLGAYYALQPAKFWQLSINGRLSTIDIQPYRDLPLGKANLNIYGNISNDLLLPKSFKIGVGLDFSNLSSDQFYHHRGYSNLSASVSKEFKKPQLNVYIRANDIFRTSFTGNTALFLPYDSQSYNDRRVTTLGITYRFGKQTVKVTQISKDDNLEESNKRL